MGTNQVPYRLGRWRTVAMAILSAGLAAMLFLSSEMVSLPWRFLPWIGTAVFGAITVRLILLLIEPTVITIGDDGIEARNAFGRRGWSWRQFEMFRQHEEEGGRFINLHFRAPSGDATILGLSDFAGTAQDLIVQDATRRLLALGIQPKWWK